MPGPSPTTTPINPDLIPNSDTRDELAALLRYGDRVEIDIKHDGQSPMSYNVTSRGLIGGRGKYPIPFQLWWNDFDLTVYRLNVDGTEYIAGASGYRYPESWAPLIGGLEMVGGGILFIGSAFVAGASAITLQLEGVAFGMSGMSTGVSAVQQGYEYLRYGKPQTVPMPYP
ncbi:MAG: hypothetical protein FJZ95_01200 [Chloroflexi bacterium]|nr:hypothetical protein [Chloroflexota bacterium]